ncbi:MAG: hypothetical protein JW952_06505 [Candidatus Eisenbacteria bacterium]|nr:hypothetical protein [Candidatus Eisenbacteria bacterium]
MRQLLLLVRLLASGIAVMLIAGVTLAQPLPDWALNQNSPNPFCNESSITRIQYALAQQCDVLLRVWSPDTTAVVRVLVDEAQAAGYHEVVWDGRDGGGVLLGNGEYPYNLTATQTGGGPVLFESMLVASIHCVPIRVDLGTWGRMKELFR